MKKILFLLLFLASFINAYSQEYQFKRVFINGSLLKINGEIIINDTSFILKQAGQKDAEYQIEGNFKNSEGSLIIGQYFNVVLGTKQQEIRVMINQNTFNSNKAEPYVFIMDYKDNFTNTLMNSIYYLIPK